MNVLIFFGVVITMFGLKRLSKKYKQRRRERAVVKRVPEPNPKLRSSKKRPLSVLHSTNIHDYKNARRGIIANVWAFKNQPSKLTLKSVQVANDKVRIETSGKLDTYLTKFSEQEVDSEIIVGIKVKGTLYIGCLDSIRPTLRTKHIPINGSRGFAAHCKGAWLKPDQIEILKGDELVFWVTHGDGRFGRQVSPEQLISNGVIVTVQ